jgi:glycerol uptake facilitator-like aquaporin
MSHSISFKEHLNGDVSYSDRSQLIADIIEREKKQSDLEITNEVKNQYIEEIYKDKSPEAKAGRRGAMWRAAYGEFMCSFIFFFLMYGIISYGTLDGWEAKEIKIMVALNNGFQVIANTYCFSSVSGAHINPAVSFSLWLTKKLSNRKLVLYICVQLLASVCGMAVVVGIFVGDHDKLYTACVVEPFHGDNHLGKVFATEYILTFVVTYIAFAVAFEDAESQKRETMTMNEIARTRGLTVYSTIPTAKTGFAPFVIGFTVFSLVLITGASGGAINAARMFGPAILSGKWKNFHIYVLGQFLGASSAGLMVNNLHKRGLLHHNEKKPPKRSSSSTVQM